MLQKSSAQVWVRRTRASTLQPSMKCARLNVFFVHVEMIFVSRKRHNWAIFNALFSQDRMLTPKQKISIVFVGLRLSAGQQEIGSTW